jgi:hypothetical protein
MIDEITVPNRKPPSPWPGAHSAQGYPMAHKKGQELI